MKVKELISRLKKLNQNAEIGFCDHDSDDYTVSSWVHGAIELDFDKIPYDKESENIWGVEGKIVIIH